VRLSPHVSENVVNVQLADLLSKYGIPGVALLRLHKEPDVFIILRGVRVIIESKIEGNRSALVEQLSERIQEDLCDVAVGLLVPRGVIERGSTPLGPTPIDVWRNLQSASLSGLVLVSTSPRLEEFSCSVAELAELLHEFCSRVLGGAELDRAVAAIKEGMKEFADHLLGLETIESICDSAERLLSGADG